MDASVTVSWRSNAAWLTLSPLRGGRLPPLLGSNLSSTSETHPEHIMTWDLSRSSYINVSNASLGKHTSCTATHHPSWYNSVLYHQAEQRCYTLTQVYTSYPTLNHFCTSLYFNLGIYLKLSPQHPFRSAGIKYLSLQSRGCGGC